MGLRLKPRQSVHYCAGLVLAVVPLTLTSATAPATTAVAEPEPPAAAMTAELPFGDDPTHAWAPSRSANRFESLSAVTGAALVGEDRSDVRVSSPKGTRVWTASAMSDHGVPAAAERAYRRAARTMAELDPSCQLPWTLLAAIGRVESDHGRYGGSVLGTDGVSHPRIIGVQLNGAGPVAAIRDTDDGKLDGDRVWDRAVGPMQFIPSTWAGAARDGDGDGTASPNDLDDAALAAAGYLCSGYGSVLGDSAMGAAVYRYNQDDYYVALVLAFEDGYRTGVFILPPPPEPEQDAKRKRRERADDGDRVRTGDVEVTSTDRDRAGTRRTSGEPEPTSAPSPKPKPKPTSSPTASPTPTPTPSPGPDEPTAEPEDPAPVLTGLSGALTSCGSSSGWCMDGTPLDFGPDSQLARTAAADYSGDGARTDNAQELEGLSAEGAVVELMVEMVSGVAVVYVIDDRNYRYGDGSYA